MRWAHEEPQPRARQRSSKSTPETPQPDPTLSTVTSLDIVGRLGGDDATRMTAWALSPNFTDLELMMQWCNSTYQDLSRNEKTDTIWQCLVPEEALEHPFLMHGILALSALHLARTRNDHRRPMYSNIAIAHQNQALALFRDLLGNINASNAKAMFAFASIVVLYTFGFPHESNSSDSWTSIDDLYQVIVLIRGVQHVINTASTSLRDSSFQPLMHIEDPEPFLPDDAQAALDELHEANNACGAQDETHDTEIYEDTIHKLSSIMSMLQRDLNSLTTAGRWAIKVRTEYVDLVREHAPLALVVLAYYCVILHCLRHHWCLWDWSYRVSRAIWLVLDAQWRPLVRWPMITIFGHAFMNET